MEDEDDKFDIIAESKKKLAKKVREQQESSQIAKNVMTNKNRKLLKVIEHSVGEKKAVASKLKEKQSFLLSIQGSFESVR